MGKIHFLIPVFIIKKILFFGKKAYLWLSKQLSINKRIKITKSICKNKLTNRLAYDISLGSIFCGKETLPLITSFEDCAFFI